MMASMTNFNPAGYTMPMQQHQQQPQFAQGLREGTPQQPQGHQPFHPHTTPVTYQQPQFSPPAFYPPQSFGTGPGPAQGNGVGSFGGGMNVQQGLPIQYPLSSQPSYTTSSHTQPVTSSVGIGHPYNAPTTTPGAPSFSSPTNPIPPQQMNNPQGQMNPQQQQSQQQQLQQQSPMGTQLPQSPTTAAREKSRVSTLLEINSALLQEVVSLQSQGKVGVPPNQQGQTSPSQGTPIDPSAPSPTTSTPTMDTSVDPVTGRPAQKGPSSEYVNCMRRLQANLAYLATIADRAKKPGASLPQGPAILDHPPHMSNLEEPYRRLRELFPDAGKKYMMQQMQQAQAMQRQNAGMTISGTG